MSRPQHLQVMFLLAVYGNQSYVLYSPRDDHARSCGFHCDAMLGSGDVRAQSCDSHRDALQGGGDSHVRHYGSLRKRRRYVEQMPKYYLMGGHSSQSYAQMGAGFQCVGLSLLNQQGVDWNLQGVGEPQHYDLLGER